LKYEGDFYSEIGDFIKEKYFDNGFTEGTQSEVDFVEKELALPAGASIIDIGCGPGRHSLELARRGYKTLGIDISAGFIEIAKRQAAQERLTAEFQVMDARNLKVPEGFDAAICLCEGAFGLAGDEDAHRQILAGVYRVLKPEAHFILTAASALNVAQNVNKFEAVDPYTSTLTFKETITSPTGEQREAQLFTTAFTYRELKFLFEEAGFEVEVGYGCIAGRFERKPLTFDDFEIMIVARK
jgi:SAM-dependent methyltransferase